MAFVADPLPVPPVSEGTITLPHMQEKASSPPSSVPQEERASPALETTSSQQEEQVVEQANMQGPVEDSIAGLTETTAYGMLPQIRKEDGLSSFKAYQAAFTPRPETKAIISLAMVDFGLSPTASLSALNHLPKGISYVASPHTPDLQSWVRRARESGDEVWLTLPLQTAVYPRDDSGPLTILAGDAEKTNEARLFSVLGKATGYVGVVLTGSPDFSSDKAGLNSIFAILGGRGLGMVQADVQDQVASSYAAQNSLPFAQGAHWLDINPQKENVEEAFRQIETDAMDHRVSVAFFRPYPSLLPVLTAWQKSLEAKGIEIAPLSAAIVNK